MPTILREIAIETKGEVEITDITGQVARIIRESGITTGLACVFNSGSTGAVTTIEFEPGLLIDLPNALEKMAPKNIRYHHDERWHDGNGHSHVRASILGPSLTVPFKDGHLLLGTWQQIVFVELDVRPRKRHLVIQIVGDSA